MKALKVWAALFLGVGLSQWGYGATAPRVTVTYADLFYPENAIKRSPSIFLKDPYIWVYTSAFAKRYGMPEQWVDDRIQGADAVAFRLEPQPSITCGFGEGQDDCRQILECRFDFYLPKKANLPWQDDRPQGFNSRSSVHSARFLVPQRKEDEFMYDPTALNPHNTQNSPGGLFSMRYTVNSRFNSFDAQYGHGAFSIDFFDRDYLKETDFISTTTRCSALPEKKQGIPAITVYKSGESDKKNTENRSAVYSAQLPRSFLDRVNSAYFHGPDGKLTGEPASG